MTKETEQPSPATHVVVAYPTWHGTPGVVRFEVYSSSAPATVACVAHDFCSAVPEGERWGCVNFQDQAAAERAVSRAFPSVTSFTWINAILTGVWPEIQQFEDRIAAAKARVRAAFGELQAVEAERNSLAAPRVLKEET